MIEREKEMAYEKGQRSRILRNQLDESGANRSKIARKEEKIEATKDENGLDTGNTNKAHLKK